MTGSVVIELGVSLAGVLILVFVSYLLGAWKTISVDAASAEERLRFDEPDFEAVDWLIDCKGGAAVAANEAGETALVFRKGDELASRRMKPGEGRVKHDGAVLRVKPAGDHTVRALVLDAGDPEVAAAWARKIAGDRDI